MVYHVKHEQPEEKKKDLEAPANPDMFGLGVKGSDL